MSMSLTNILLTETYVERSDAYVVELGKEAAVQVPKSVDVVAHLVLDGEIVIDVEQMETSINVGRGEFGLLMYGNDHLIRARGVNATTQRHVMSEWPIGEAPATLTVGKGEPAARFISAALRLVYNPVSVQCIHPLPELIHLSHDMSSAGSGSALLTDMDVVVRSCRGPGGNAFVNALMNLHLLQAMRYSCEQIGSVMPLLNPTDVFLSRTFRPVALAARMLRMHPERHWTVAELARQLGLSRSSLASHFSASVGIGPMEYLTKVRMEKASELLRTRQDLSLCAIGRRVGYDNASSFVRAFKGHFGVPPKVFSNQDKAYAACACAASSYIGSEQLTAAS